MLAQKIEALRAECKKVGRDPATLRLSEQAILVIVKDKAELDAAMPTARRHYGDEAYGLDAAGYIGTPDAIIKRIRERAALGVTLFTFFFHDRAQLKTLELFAKEVLPAFA